MNYLLRFGPTRVQLCSNIVFSKLLGEQEEHGTLTEAAVASAQFCAVLRSSAQFCEAVLCSAQFKLLETADPCSNMEVVFQGVQTQRNTTSQFEH